MLLNKKKLGDDRSVIPFCYIMKKEKRHEAK